MEWFISLSSRISARIFIDGRGPGWVVKFFNALPSAQGSRKSVELNISIKFKPFPQLSWSGPPLSIEKEGKSIKVRSVDLEGEGDGLCWNAEIGGPGGLQNLLLVAVSFASPFAGEVLVHASSCLRRKSAVIFPGVSGAGKSTIAGILRKKGWLLLGDDIILLTDQGTIDPVYGVQTHGPETGPHEYRCIIAFPRKAQSIRMEGISFADGFSRMLECAPFIHVHPYIYEIALDIIDSALKKVNGIYVLYFERSGEFVEVLKDALDRTEG